MTTVKPENEKKQQKHKIPQETMAHIANGYMNETVTNSDIFTMVREFQQSALDRDNRVFTNVGELYWHLIKVRDEKKAG